MKDYLLNCEGCKIKCEIEGRKMTYTFDDSPKDHYVVTLRNIDMYDQLKDELKEMYNSFDNRIDGLRAINDYIQSVDCHDKYFIGRYYGYSDLRTREEINEYEKEADDKVWLMRSHPCDNPKIEQRRIESIKRILNTYNDIPKEGYTDWECGYWNGIMGALRWVLGDEKDTLHT